LDKKSKAQIYLERVEMLDNIIENKLIESQQWRDLALSITANMGGDKVQASGSPSKMADAVEKCIDIEREIDEYIDRLIDTKKEVIHTLEKMDNPTEYKILHMRYIQQISLTDIAEKLNREYSSITTTHGRALKSVQKLIDKR
jgi:hypothetical protein